MEWLSPVSLAWLGLLAPLVLLYVLKRRRVAREVSSTWLWEAALRDLRAERPWKRLIVQLALILQALAIVLGALSLARPVGAGAAREGTHSVVVIDASASMAALRNDGKMRLQRAQAEAIAIAKSLPPGGEMAIVEACEEPALLLPSTRDAVKLIDAIQGLRPRCARADLDKAIALAERKLKDARAKKIVVWSDMAIPGELAVHSEDVEIRSVSTAARNLGITALDIRAASGDSGSDRVEIFARIGKQGGGARSVYVTAYVEGRGTVAARRVEIGAEGSASVAMDAELPPDNDGRAPIVRVALSRSEDETEEPRDDSARDDSALDDSALDDFALDNVAFAAGPGARKLPVFLVGSAPAPVVRVLRSDDNVELFATTLEALTSAGSEAPSLDGLVVYSGRVPDRPPSTDSVVIAPEGARAFEALLDLEVRAPRIVTWDEADPRMRFVSMRDVWIERGRAIRSGAGRALVRTDDGTMIAALSRATSETTWIGFDPARSDWPSKPSFVVFFRNLLERARERRAAGEIASGTLGAPLFVPAPDGTRVVVHTPEGKTRAVEAHGGAAIVPTEARPGVYQVEVGARRLSAIRHLLDEAESDLRPRLRVVRGGRAIHTDRQDAPVPSEYWPYLALAMLLALVAEAFWATRREAA